MEGEHKQENMAVKKKKKKKHDSAVVHVIVLRFTVICNCYRALDGLSLDWPSGVNCRIAL